jgi:hypothetical protein
MKRSRYLSLGLIAMLLASGCGSSSGAANGGDDSGSSTGDDAATTTSGGDDASTADVSETAAPPAYPAGPYGVTIRKVFPNATFKVYAGPSDLSKVTDTTVPMVDLHMSDYYDPDGSKGITAIYLDSSAVWCPHCKSEAHAMPNAYRYNYQARGVRFITVMVQGDVNAAGNATLPVQESDAVNWIKNYKSNYATGIDPWYTSFIYPTPTTAADLDKALAAAGSTIGFPNNLVIDPRTMKVFRVIAGGDDYVWPCTTQADCCLYANPPPGCLATDSTGAVVESPSQDYVCDTTQKLCVGYADSTGVGEASPFPDIDLLIAKNGGAKGPAVPTDPPPPADDAGTDAGAASDGGAAATDAASGG